MNEVSITLAIRARTLAQQHCNNGEPAAIDCEWYHSFWPTLRALQLVTVPEHHRAFYRQAIRIANPSQQALAVLVCGAADAAMPTLVSEALPDSSQLTVLDRCSTPLHLARAAFEGQSNTVRTTQAHALDDQLLGPFNLIVTHSFMGYFHHRARPQLFQNWFRWLRPAGNVITINRIRPEMGDEEIGFTAEQAESFVNRTVEAAPPNVLTRLGLSATKLRCDARRYAERFRIHPIDSRAKLIGQFEAAGFTVQTTSLGGVESGVNRPPTGPTTPGAATYDGYQLTRPG